MNGKMHPLILREKWNFVFTAVLTLGCIVAGPSFFVNGVESTHWNGFNITVSEAVIDHLVTEEEIF